MKARVLAALVLLSPSAAFAGIPHLINLEARLTDVNGNPIQTATQVEFDLYQGGSATSVGSGTVVYQEIATITPASDGTYSYLFGSGGSLNGTQLTSAAFNTTQPMFIQISINNQVILPRLQIVSQAWALMAENVIDGAITNAKMAANSVTTTNISTGAVTSAQLDPTTASNYLVPSGAIMMFSGSCPPTWTRFSALDNLFPMGGPNYGQTGGSATHSHTVNPHTHSISNDGDHSHSYSGTTSGPSGSYCVSTNCNDAVANMQHTHTYSGTTSSAGDHNHGGATGSASPGTDSQSNIPPYMTVVYCQKQ